jgi:hypothetical protein
MDAFIIHESWKMCFHISRLQAELAQSKMIEGVPIP